MLSIILNVLAVFLLFYNPAYSFGLWLFAIYFDRKSRGL